MLRRYVLDGNFAIEAVPWTADEVRGDGFGYVDGAVWKDGDLGVEFFDAEFFGECGREVEDVEEAQEVEERTQGESSRASERFLGGVDHAEIPRLRSG